MFKIEYIQLALERAGVFEGAINGELDERTRKAIVKFQKSNGIEVTGEINNETRQLLIPYLKGYIVHEISSGDTFYKLSDRYKTDLMSIIRANPSADPYNLRIRSDVIIPLGYPATPENVVYTSQLCDFVIDGIIARYPFVKSEVIGKSIMGREIRAIRIGRGKARVFYNAAHHANEWITTPVLLKFAEQYARSFALGEEIFGVSASELFDKATLYIVPMVNPDGVDLVNGALRESPYFEKARKYAENYPDIPFPAGWKANISGVDLNLQYPANWEKAREIKFARGFTSPGPRDYVGRAPLSEPESTAVYEYTRNRDFDIILAYHTQGELIYWKYLDMEPDNSRIIARYFGDVSGYAVEETPYSSGFAGYKDWFIQEYDRPGYTIEVGKGQNPLPLSQFDKIYSDNLGILVGAITQI